VQSCGHDVFYFPYLQGKTTCPICDIPIIGWQKLKPKVLMKINPLVLSLGDAFDIVVDPAICVEKKRKKCKRNKKKQENKQTST